MIENIFYVLIMTLFFSFSVGVIEFSYVNRTFELLLRAPIELAIITIDENGETNPYFDEDKVVENLDNYFKNNLPRFVHDYTYEYYFSYKDKGGYCLDHKCDAFKVSLKAKISGMFTFNKAKAYFISEGRLINDI